jgi:hypothetical protein
MTHLQTISDLWRGVRTSPWKTAQYAFTNFSVLFTIVRAITHFLPTIKIEGPVPFSAALLVSVGFALNKVWKPSRIEVAIANCNTVIEIVFGDLFAQSGIRVIPVNEYFDSQLGRPVSDKSVHGIFLQRCFGGHPESFDKQIDQELKDTQSTRQNKIEGKVDCYPIGTTALLNVNQDRYIAFASAKTDPTTCKAFSDVNLMWVSLHKLWQRARIESGGHTVNLPLVGSGLSGVGLPTRDLLNLIVLSAITETKMKEITQRIRIVVHRDRFGDIDLRDVKKHWKE